MIYVVLKVGCKEFSVEVDPPILATLVSFLSPVGEGPRGGDLSFSFPGGEISVLVYPLLNLSLFFDSFFLDSFLPAALAELINYNLRAVASFNDIISFLVSSTNFNNFSSVTLISP